MLCLHKEANSDLIPLDSFLPQLKAIKLGTLNTINPHEASKIVF
ncbi:hypothetical protein EV07_1385 [Prochlorococcus sp. MIT 0603]|nr:hypothetical protein EV07_1385 [Prochlorococcus sp. MIT 0603]